MKTARWLLLALLVLALLASGASQSLAQPAVAPAAVTLQASSGRATLASDTQSVDFPTTIGAFDTSGNSGDAYVTRLTTDGRALVYSTFLGGAHIDRDSPSGTGIDMVHIYLDGPYGTGAIIGGATNGLDRPDVAAQYGERFRPSGWELAWDTSGLAPGVHRLYRYAHLTIDNAWARMVPHLVILSGGPSCWLPIIWRQQ